MLPMTLHEDQARRQEVKHVWLAEVLEHTKFHLHTWHVHVHTTTVM